MVEYENKLKGFNMTEYGPSTDAYWQLPGDYVPSSMTEHASSILKDTDDELWQRTVDSFKQDAEMDEETKEQIVTGAEATMARIAIQMAQK